MDKVKHYQQILHETVTRHASFQPANGNIKTYAVVDEASNNYMVIDAGWSDKGRRIYDVTLHFRLESETLFVERDTTDAEVVRELLERGIDKNDIVLAFNEAPFQKLSDSIAA
jgi:XisI protein